MRIDRYLGAQLFAGTALALAALLTILTLIDFMNEVGGAGAEGALGVVVRYVGLTTPGRVYELLPVAILIGGLLSLGNLAAQSELVALRAAGYSKQRIISSALGVGCAFALFTAALGETLLPPAESAAARISGGAERSGVFQRTGVGIWSREGRRFIHVRGENPAPNGGGEYSDATIYEFDGGGRLRRVVNAASMDVESGRLVLRGVREARLGEDRIEVSRRERAEVERGAELDEGALGAAPPASMNSLELIRHVAFLKRSSLRHDLHELSLWLRLSQPLSVLVMLLLALPFVFAPVRTGAGQRLFYGILIGLTYMLVTRIFSNAAVVFEFPPAAGALAPPLLGFAAGWYRLARYR